MVTTKCSPRAAASHASALVRVERVDALRRERLAHARVQLLGQRREDRVSRAGYRLEMGELLAFEQVGPARGDAHRRASQGDEVRIVAVAQLFEAVDPQARGREGGDEVRQA